jgi:hypothetical protein
VIDYRLDEARCLAFVTLSGALTDAGAIAWLRGFLQDMSKRSRVGGVVDARGLTEFQVSSEAVRQMNQMVQESEAAFAGSRWAIVAGEDVVFGMARMYELLRGGAAYEIRVFRSEEEARRWVEESA